MAYNAVSLPVNSREIKVKVKELFPLNSPCQVERLIFQATVTCDGDPTYGKKFYIIALAEPKFKKLFANHKT